MTCCICDWAEVYKAHRCAACYWYRYRHGGLERPEELIVKHGARWLASHPTSG